MCYDNKDRPPDAPGEAEAANGEDVELVSADGTHFAAYLARPAGLGARAQVIIFPDVRGLHDFYKALAMRFAEKGIDAIAIDYFGRTAGMSPRDDTFEFMPHVGQMQFPSFMGDVRAARAYVDSTSSAPLPTFSLGFCMGGALSLLAGTEDLDLAGVVAFYAGMGRKFAGSDRGTLEKATEMRAPVLGLFGGADQGIPPSDVQKLDEALDTAGVEHEIITYPGAPHSFFDRKAVEYVEASADAWQRVLSFIEAHSRATS